MAVEPDVVETREGEPKRVVIENARRKARSAADQAAPDALVLGADTEVVIDGRVLGQAGEAGEARAHLETLSGRTHTVLTGVVLLGPGNRRGDPRGRGGVASSRVTFRELDPGTLDLYLGSGEWRGRAGAYAIQGLGSILIARLEGDFSNVVGLPVPLLLELAPELVDRRDVRGR
jgi:septum formation protein